MPFPQLTTDRADRRSGIGGGQQVRGAPSAANCSAMRAGLFDVNPPDQIIIIGEPVGVFDGGMDLTDPSHTPQRLHSHHVPGGETPHGLWMSSSVLLIFVGVGGPGGGLVVGGVGLQAAVQDADQPVGQLAQGGVVAYLPGAQLVVVGAGTG